MLKVDSNKSLIRLKRLWDWLGSKELSVFLFITAMLYSLIAYVFALLVPPDWFQFFQTLLPLVVVYIAFFVNLLICEIKWIPVVLRRCKRPERPESDGEFGRFREKVEIQDSGLRTQGLKKYLKRRGYFRAETRCL